MSKCEKCGGKGYIEVEDVTVYPKTLTRMICTECEQKPMTNLERIQKMTVEEMAEFLNEFENEDICINCLINVVYKHDIACSVEKCNIAMINWLNSECEVAE